MGEPTFGELGCYGDDGFFSPDIAWYSLSDFRMSMLENLFSCY